MLKFDIFEHRYSLGHFLSDLNVRACARVFMYMYFKNNLYYMQIHIKIKQTNKIKLTHIKLGVDLQINSL